VVLETSVSYRHPTRLTAREDFISFNNVQVIIWQTSW